MVLWRPFMDLFADIIGLNCTYNAISLFVCLNNRSYAIQSRQLGDGSRSNPAATTYRLSTRILWHLPATVRPTPCVCAAAAVTKTRIVPWMLAPCPHHRITHPLTRHIYNSILLHTHRDGQFKSLRVMKAPAAFVADEQFTQFGHHAAE
jgi:hypothetical protein